MFAACICPVCVRVSPACCIKVGLYKFNDFNLDLDYNNKTTTLRFDIANVPTHLFGVVQVFPVQDVMGFRCNCARLSVLIKIVICKFGPPTLLKRTVLEAALLALCCWRGCV